MDDLAESTTLLPPLLADVHDMDLEAGSSVHILCRICLESQGEDLIAPCKCKGTSKYVHRDCLDHWRAVKEGFAFAHCTTCKSPYRLRLNVLADRKWRTLKFRFFVTRDILFIFLSVQLVISSLAYLVYVVDGYQKFWLRLEWGSESAASFYYTCGALLFFALVGLSGCLITWICAESVNCHLPGPLCTGTESGCTTCFESECDCASGGGGESGLPLVLTMALIVLVVFAVIGIFYSVLVATMVAQRIWQRHYHILAKMSLTKEYIVEDVDDEMGGSPPALPPEHVQQLETLGLL
uniref:RING-CH-type domain-containing protein n=1 Tax=Daucus carota subsp. sativus TaxID=79200 RepID=A0A164TZJ0_DAUCS